MSGHKWGKISALLLVFEKYPNDTRTLRFIIGLDLGSNLRIWDRKVFLMDKG